MRKILYLNGDSWTFGLKTINGGTEQNIFYKSYDIVINDAVAGSCNKQIWLRTKEKIKEFSNLDQVDMCIFLSESLRGEKEFKIFQFLANKYGVERGFDFLLEKLLEVYKNLIIDECKSKNINVFVTTAFVNCPWQSKLSPMYKMVYEHLNIKDDSVCYVVSPRTIDFFLSQIKKLNFTEKEKYKLLQNSEKRINLLNKFAEPDFDAHYHDVKYANLICKQIAYTISTKN